MLEVLYGTARSGLETRRDGRERGLDKAKIAGWELRDAPHVGVGTEQQMTWYKGTQARNETKRSPNPQTAAFIHPAKVGVEEIVRWDPSDLITQAASTGSLHYRSSPVPGRWVSLLLPASSLKSVKSFS